MINQVVTARAKQVMEKHMNNKPFIETIAYAEDKT